MKKIERISGTAAPLLVDNISTDIISPSILLQSVNADLAGGLFGPWRYLREREENPDFVLNDQRFRSAKVLVTGKNFGCGSSREHAVWCLLRYGVQCVIAPSFGDIFYESAFKNGLVAVTLPEAEVESLARDLVEANAPQVEVDIRDLTINGPLSRVRRFALDASRRDALLDGLDEIDIILRQRSAIDDFQARAKIERPWLYPTAAFTAERLRETG
ncbi:3-isopropylmalate dehydratase small subunit [Terrarubrum flagellatum]|uniref:3-isopropylmalate dehydratase small subunit n=1 Tax=Terrirubrum flagellatum TaxID=2895980 RepID=UPI0031455396